ncbi:MAG: nucleotidyltransferase domain-containing protein [Spirochaetaceae bacterium]|jgi:predicted nucleotidyltransferase|nr:nucleotidyltransferase domain-containing protein [Spirochaetaceae bacterium]
MVSSRKEVLSKILTPISEEDDLDLCILYGSAALDRLSLTSDIDIAVGSEKSLTNDFCMELSGKLSLLTDREVSIINIEKMEGVILQEVLVKGITLKNLKPAYKTRFLSKMYEYTEDILPFQMMGINKKVADFINE